MGEYLRELFGRRIHSRQPRLIVMISSVKLVVAIALVSYIAHVTVASSTICYDGAGSYNDPYDCHK